MIEGVLEIEEVLEIEGVLEIDISCFSFIWAMIECAFSAHAVPVKMVAPLLMSVSGMQ